MGEQAFLSTTAAFLARAVFAQGRVDEADELAQLSARLTAPDDLLTQLLWRGVQARASWRRADDSTRPRRSRARRCHSREQTDFIVQHGDALVDLAHILREAGRDAEATVAAEGLHLHEQKGNLVTAGRIRSDFSALL